MSSINISMCNMCMHPIFYQFKQMTNTVQEYYVYNMETLLNFIYKKIKVHHNTKIKVETLRSRVHHEFEAAK